MPTALEDISFWREKGFLGQLETQLTGAVQKIATPALMLRWEMSLGDGWTVNRQALVRQA